MKYAFYLRQFELGYGASTTDPQHIKIARTAAFITTPDTLSFVPSAKKL
jgi:hypothetical protein